MTVLRHLITRFTGSPSICSLMRIFSYETWDKIKFVRVQAGLKMYETTVTQNWLYDFKLFTSFYPANIKMSEAIDEKTNGNDIELEIHTAEGIFLVPLQAKIIYHHKYKRTGIITEKYDQMQHGNQIIDLIAYAKARGGFPMYLLYNYSFNPSFSIPSIGYEFGCTIVSADYLLNNFVLPIKHNTKGVLQWKIPHFTDLHLNPVAAVPWWQFACHLTSKTTKRDLFSNLLPEGAKIDEIISNIRPYTQEEIDNDKRWRPLVAEIEQAVLEKAFRTMPITNGKADDNQNNGFNPKFRIIFLQPL